ncbi:hypothetical protein MCEET85_00877 [Candidatus Methylopumilus planktonicus]
MRYKLPKGANEYVLLQRTSLIKDTRSKLIKKLSLIGMGKSYESVVKEQSKENNNEISDYYYTEIEKVFNAVKTHIPKHTKSILDVGSGLAGLEVFLWALLKKNQPKIYLLDKTRREKKIWYEFKNHGAFYNSLGLAKKNLISNGVVSSKINLIEAPYNGVVRNIKNIDLVVSTISWGFHYPIDMYLNSVITIMSKSGVLILDIRKNTGGLEILASKFKTIHIIKNEKKYLTVKCLKKDLVIN